MALIAFLFQWNFLLEIIFLPANKILKQSTLGWYVNRKFVSYNQIKRHITPHQ